MNWNWDDLEEKKQKNTAHKIPQDPQNKKKREDSFIKFEEFFGNFRKMSLIITLLLVIFWLAQGFYIVQPDELGVVTRFGKYIETTEPGPHYKLPYPIYEIYKPKVFEVKRFEVGFVNASASNSESEMLTKDENIVNVQFSVQYQINDPVKYLFKAADQHELLKNASQSVMREVIGSSDIDAALTEGKQLIQTTAASTLQEIADNYNLGVKILAVQMQNVYPPEAVSEAFKDVASAREDKSRFINEALAYRNEIIPRARGRAAEMLNQAEGYQIASLKIATAEAERFSLLLEQYVKSPEVTRKRLYLETMQRLFSAPELQKVIIPSTSAGTLLPYLPLNKKTNAIGAN
ncbi:MAG: FtsH protease activity modulator HflK [Desulfovibrionaceae bacterium]